ncbi:hypothetical protein PHISCL_02053 [Aspergillus sclerotialis]|uniref:RRM domain-containing protein n=1 Tax=Aspergillus sclerotialis TaxID=2070753 RepID=A0A3A2ZRE3_9EURO|nr:hypothetical protein PHISCL_02053 [Aspergillus sclerotialis]
MDRVFEMDQSAFNALLQRPEFQNRSSNDAHLPEPDTVTIPRSEYDQLRQDACHFQKLKDSLLNGGLLQETLDILIYGTKPTPEIYHDASSYQTAGPTLGGMRPANRHKSEKQANGSEDVKTKMAREHSNGTSKLIDFDVGNGDHNDDGDEDEDEDDDAGVVLSQDSHGKEDEEPESGRSSAVPSGQRTVVLRGLPDWVSHQQITEAIRGGAILHLYLRGREHMANVSFVEESSAQEFLDYAKTHGIYIVGKRVEALWGDRQFYLPPYIKSKIYGGATRNIALYNVNSSITESLIRNDLDHIHNLVVVSVKFKDGNAYISTNSIHNALFARSCMMSRFTYKGMRIAFYPDECAEPLPKLPAPVPAPAKTENQAPPKKHHSHPNRFQLLSLDGTEDENDDFEEEHIMVNGKASLNGGGISWTDNRVLV